MGLTLLSVLAAAATPARAQLEFARPGDLAEIPDDLRSRLERGMAEARFELGRLRVDPWVGIEDGSYQRDLAGAGDVTATAGAGARAYLPVRSKVILVGYALPRYVWWSRQSERRRLDGRYGLGAFGFWNRLRLEAAVARDDAQSLVSPQSDQRVHQRNDHARLALEMSLGGPLRLFGVAQGLAVETLDLPGATVAFSDALDRRERGTSVGLKLALGGRLELSVAGEHSRADATSCVGRCGGSGDAVIVEARYEGPHLAIVAVPEQRSQEWRGARFRGTTGRLSIVVEPRRRLSGSIYAGRQLYFGLDPLRPLVAQERFGAALSLDIGWRSSAQLFAERGRNVSMGTAADRSDGAGAVGASLVMPVVSKAALSLAVTRSDYGGSVGARSGPVTEVRLSLSLGARGLPW